MKSASITLFTLICVLSTSSAWAMGKKPTREDMDAAANKGKCADSGPILSGTSVTNAVAYPTCVSQAIRKKEDVNQHWVSTGSTPLHFLTMIADWKSGNPPESARLLLEAGAKADALSSSGESPLMILSRQCEELKHLSECMVMTTALLDHGANPLLENSDGATSIKLALFNYNPRMAMKMIGAVRDINFIDSSGMGAIHYLVGASAASTPGVTSNLFVELIAKRGANLDLHGPTSMTPLQMAIANGLNEIAAMLIDAGADLNAGNPLLGSALHVAAKKGSADMIQLLISRGATATVNAKNSAGASPLHLAAEAGQPNAVAALLKAGADPSAVDTRGATPLQFAEGRIAVIPSEGNEHELSKLSRVIELLQKAVKEATPKPEAAQPTQP